MKGKVYKEKPPVCQDDDEDAVIQPRAGKAKEKLGQGRPSDGAGGEPKGHGPPAGNLEENYRSHDLQEQVQEQRIQDDDDEEEDEFEGRKQVNQSLKNKNNISEFQARNS